MRDWTQADLVKILNIGQPAIHALASQGRIPYKGIISASGDSMRFCPEAIARWIEGLDLTEDGISIDQHRDFLLRKFPEKMRALEEFGGKFSRPPKYYYLDAVPSKKMGRIWYVRYLDNGRLVPSRWSTGTADEGAAKIWAVENRERILAGYYGRKATPTVNLYRSLKRYYEKNSPLLHTDVKRGRVISEKRQSNYDGFVKKKFIPFLRRNGVKTVDEIDTAMLARFQNHLLKTVKPQSVNSQMSGVKMIFSHFVTNGYIKFNPCAGLPAIRVQDVEATGCYEIGALKGVFEREWTDELHRLLCLLIYTTNMRNSEIRRIEMSDVIEIGGIRFIDIPESKSRNGVRVVPLHDFVYGKLAGYAIRNPGLFSGMKERSFQRACSEANLSLAGLMGYSEEMVERDNIRFYSGRHYWKTLMNSEGLGDIEEYFMGHKVSGDIAKRYNYRDKQGREKLAEKARDVFAALDRRLFDIKPEP